MAKVETRRGKVKRAKPPKAPLPGSEDPAGVPFHVVGIGGSAGGLEAFSEFLRSVPPQTGLAYVFIQHLDPKHASLLAELLARQTEMPVTEVKHGMRVEPDHVYVIPRNTSMSIVRGTLKLAPRPSLHSMPIDFFLKSLAQDQKSLSIGVVLSGSASDGAVGLRAIKAAGGVTFAQLPETAKYDGMPRAAIGAGCVDFVLSPQNISKELVRLAKHPYIDPATYADKPPAAAANVHPILSILNSSMGVDFTHYKPSTIRRRILRRMALRRVEKIERYVSLLRSEPEEVEALFEDILINITEFFRDPGTFDTLQQQIFPRILAERQAGTPIRIWVPGCSTGEEVYSIGMCLLEFLNQATASAATPVQIFGTDISELALARARAGIYGENIADFLPRERLNRFFTRSDNGFQISKKIRDLCVFARQNMAKDPPFSKLDLISCRNVLIYLGPILQNKMIPLFHYGLRPNGYLILGSSETVGSHGDMFKLVNQKHKIYQRQPGTNRAPVDFVLPDEKIVEPLKDIKEVDWTELDLHRETDRLILSRYSPAAVVIDDEFNILQFRGRTSPYLEPASGVASLNLMKMARTGLWVEIRTTIQKANREKAAVRSKGIPVRYEHRHRNVRIEVTPFKRTPGKGRRYLVAFHEVEAELTEQTQTVEPATGTAIKNKAAFKTLARENERLAHDLTATREYLQSIIEEQESAYEELRSANEEIQSSNEELQSTNEELETAKEELQSTNEELNTVNEELNNRNLQLAQSGNDLANVLSSVSIPIIMVGIDLRIRRFTPMSEKLFNLIPGDIGRPITDIKFNVEIPNLKGLLLDVIENLTPKIVELKDPAGHRYSLRLRPYRTEENRIDGVVMVMLLDLEAIGFEPIAEEAALASAEDSALATMMRAYAARLLVAQEVERRRIARELHDDFSQKLAVLHLGVEAIQRNPPKGVTQTKALLDKIGAGITEVSNEVRRIAYALHPSSLDDLGISASMRGYCAETSQREKIPIVYKDHSVPAIVYNDAALCLYRVLQEALRNALKHSQAKAISVTLAGADHSVRLEVKDSGIGFDPKEARGRGLGMTSMEERVRLVGGRIAIESKPGVGSIVIAEVPTERGAVLSKAPGAGKASNAN